MLPYRIRTITLALPYRLGRMNCYLVEADAGFVLLDTGGRNRRAELVRELEEAACRLDNLSLIILTHGDFDHTGNCAFLREKFGTRAAMHIDDLGMVERGDMFYNRESGNALIRTLAPILFGYGKSDRFKPDLFLEEGDDLSGYGFGARVLHLPGHSRGSIGILTAGGDLFCGDLLDDTDSPGLGSIMDDPAAAKASVGKLTGLEIHTVYPGHGKPFAWEQFVRKYQESDP